MSAADDLLGGKPRQHVMNAPHGAFPKPVENRSGLGAAQGTVVSQAKVRALAYATAPEGWPLLGIDALHGLAGDVVTALSPHTEADAAALLATFLTLFGASVGSSPHAIADGSDHPARLFTVIVGRTSRARKGTAFQRVRRVMAEADPGFVSERLLGGLASGEGLVAAVQDGTDAEGNTVPADKRLAAYEPEFARVLKVCARDGSTLSALLRDAWDRGDLRVMTRRDPLRASNAHISLLGHITVEELRRNLTETDIANGFGNRLLYIPRDDPSGCRPAATWTTATCTSLAPRSARRSTWRGGS